ncbi:MAG: protein tyrosine phosphatase family protein [Pseudomonadota bacterium]
MSANTVKTVFGFLATLTRRVIPDRLLAGRIERIYNYRNISDRIATSGQPTPAQFELIRDAGFKLVINLAPHGTENALADEAGVLASIDLPYVHIPVDFQAPSEADFEQFCDVMKAHDSKQIWVHCAANMRVSAFVYRYRRDVLGEDEAAAREAMLSIWTPFGAWKAFTRPGR